MGGEVLDMKIQDLPEQTRLIQLAEESAELAQAAIKMIRAQNGDTPVSIEEASANLMEEIADVSVCMTAVSDIVSPKEICEIITKKAHRWETRINAGE